MDALQGRPQDSHAVNIASLAQKLTQELAAAVAADSSSLPPSRFGGGPIIIGAVPNLTRNVDPAEYEPHHVSIGPYGRISKPSLARDEEKIRSLGAVLSAESTAAATTKLAAYLEELARVEVQARLCYAHSFDRMDSENFVRMLLLDACYLLVRFGGFVSASSGNAEGRYRHGGAPLTATARCGGGGDKMEALAVVRDVFYLAENQIPFFVIEKVHRITFRDGGSISAADAIGTYVRQVLLPNYSVATPTPRDQPGNLLHLLHAHFKPSVQVAHGGGDDGKVADGERVDRWRTATEYYFGAGVKFKTRPVRRDDGAQCVLDVRLTKSGGVLEIPHLSIDAETWRLLRNLMALEQRNPETAGSHITAYCVFMWQLACAPADVELLSRSGVLAHGLGTDAEVARCFADLCKGIMFSVNDRRGNYLWATCLVLDRRFRSRHLRWMTWLRRKYFRNPWLAVGLAAAVVGLVCTVVQAVYSVLSCKQAAR